MIINVSKLPSKKIKMIFFFENKEVFAWPSNRFNYFSYVLTFKYKFIFKKVNSFP